MCCFGTICPERAALLAQATKKRAVHRNSLATALQVVLPEPLTDAEVEDIRKVCPFVPGRMYTHLQGCTHPRLHHVLQCV